MRYGGMIGVRELLPNGTETVVTKFCPFYNGYVYQIIMLYTLNIHSCMCQLVLKSLKK